jgi:hypothetical protein
VAEALDVGHAGLAARLAVHLARALAQLRAGRRLA